MRDPQIRRDEAWNSAVSCSQPVGPVLPREPQRIEFMSDVAGDTDLLHASTRRSRRPSVIWLLPIVAVAIGAWLAWDTLSREGPTITISFETAEGLQAGQSQLKYRDISLGTVKSARAVGRPFACPGHGVDNETGRPAADQRRAVLGRQAETVRRQPLGPEHAGLRLVYRHAARDRPTARARRDFVGREDPPVLESNVGRPDVPGEGEPTGLGQRSVRRCSSATSRSARCWAGTSADMAE